MVSRQFFCLFMIILQHFRDSTIDSEKTFNLHWLATSGEHSYTVKAYTLIGGQEFVGDTRSGSVSPSRLLGGFDFFLLKASPFRAGGSF